MGLVSVIPAFALISVCLLFLVITWRQGWKRQKALAIVSPGFVFVLGILGRYGFGSLIISLLPAGMVISGEFNQYVTAWNYSTEVAVLWLVFIVFYGPAFFYISNSIVFRSGSNQSESRVRSILEEEPGKSSYSSDRKLLVVTALILLSIFFVGSVSASITGSFDRGSGYDYWASKPFRPEAAFVAFNRLRQIAYFLVPFGMKHSNRIGRVAILLLAGIPLALDMSTGGRGSVLYPIVMMALGLVVGCTAKKRGLLVAGLISLIVITGIPYLAAYRDSDMKTSSHMDWGLRIRSFVSVANDDRLAYRFRALGREVYACSDSFLFTPKNRGRREDGFTDINLGLIKRLMVPRVISDKKKLQKYDGSRIAQELIGTDIANWFPCITTPADLLRRGGYFAVGSGGLIMGILIGILDVGWRWIGSRVGEVEKTLLLLLPISYLQSGLHGTIHEILWQLCWELPKYIIAIILISVLARRLYGITDRHTYRR